jgi:hypothetical protein
VKGTPLYERVRGRRFRVRGGALSCAVGRGIVVTSYELRGEFAHVTAREAPVTNQTPREPTLLRGSLYRYQRTAQQPCF